MNERPYFVFEEGKQYRWVNLQGERAGALEAKGWQPCQLNGKPLRDQELTLCVKTQQTKETTE